MKERVPKLSRLGARQYFNDGVRKVHRGVDLFVPTGTPVYAPDGGAVSDFDLGLEGGRGLQIETDDGSHINLGHVQPKPNIGKLVRRNELVGTITAPPSASRILLLRAKSESSHLHFEFSCPDSSLPVILSNRGLIGIGHAIVENGRSYLNGIYAIKAGLLARPITQEPNV